MKYWFVNLGKYYKEQRKGQFIWAPIKNEKGANLQHWDNLMYVNKGDIVFCNKKGYIQSIATASCSAYASNIPNSFDQTWKPEGRRIDLKFIDLKKPFHFSDYKETYLKDINYSKNPFNKEGKSKLGYLYPIENRIAEFFITKINEPDVSEFVYETDIDLSEKIEEIQEEKEQFEKINNGSIKGYSVAELKSIEAQDYIYIPKEENGKNKILREKTDPKLKVTRMELANYLCEIDCNHKTFTSVSGKHQYLECHHIIPLNAQKDFPNVKLDSMFNIIVLCPICHSQVHYATPEEKRKIFLKMYNIRKEEMLKHGIDLKRINEVFDKYYLNKNALYF